MKSGIILRQIRKSRGFSANAFAVKLMISVVYLSMIENDRKKLSRKIAERVIEVFPDLKEEEKIALENAIYFDVEEAQKFIMSLAIDFFSNVKHKNLEQAQVKCGEIKEAMEKLAKLGHEDKLVMFS